MANRTLSYVAERYLQGCCLSSFPCGQGSLSQNKTKHSAEVFRTANAEDQEVFFDVLRYPTSMLRDRRRCSSQSQDPSEPCVLMTERLRKLHRNFISSLITIIRILDKGVSVIDEGVLQFTCLEELILSVNTISDLPAKNLPGKLRVLELYANQVSSLQGLRGHPLVHLEHLGLGNNRLGSSQDLQDLSAVPWPKLVSLDLSWSGFDQQCALVDALSALPRLRALILEGNPLTLATSYPGFVLDSLPRLLYLDEAWVSPDKRHHFSGLALQRGSLSEKAVVSFCVRRMRGLPDPAPFQESGAPEFPFVSYSYLITYEFLDQQKIKEKEESGSVGTDPKSQGHHDGVMKTTRTGGHSDVIVRAGVPKVCTPRQPWADLIDFNHTSRHHVTDLSALKSLFLQGLSVSVEEEKVLSWPASPTENTGAKPAVEKKGAGKEPTDSSQKPKDKKKKRESVVDLIQDPPLKRTVGTIHVDLQDLVLGKDRVDVTGNFGMLFPEPNVSMPLTQEKDQTKKIKEDKKKDDKKAKPGRCATAGKRNTSSKGKGQRGSEVEDPSDNSNPAQAEPLTVEFSVCLEKWLCASQATAYNEM